MNELRSRLRQPKWLSRALSVVALTAALALSGCEGLFEVTNPGPVQDDFLNKPSAAQAIVNGAHRAFNNTWNEVARVMGSVTREIFPAGNPGNFGISVNERQGVLLIREQGDKWNLANNARWIAEEAIRRFKEDDVFSAEALKSTPVVAEAYLWAGYANRMLGENFCKAVINGGGIQPHTVYFERAENQFTQAIQISRAAGSDTLELAALGGRASVRINLGDWQGAVSDAQALLAADPDFEFQTEFSASEIDQYNALFWSNADTPYQVHTVWNTFYEAYYAATGDPRVAWESVPGKPEGPYGIGPFGTVPWYPQRKYDARGAGADLTDAREMKLILAEAQLVLEDDWQQAMQIINDLRASVPNANLDPWQVTAPDELADAWTFLMRERGIELWLEARRAGDRRRWAVSDDQPWELAVPGRLDEHEVPSTTEPTHERGAGTYLAPDMDICFPVPDSERETNPNVPLG